MYRKYPKNTTQITHNTTQITHKTTQNPIIIPDDIENITNEYPKNISQLPKIFCNYCNNSFSRKDALTRHKLSYCKEKNKQNNIIEQLLENNNKLQLDISELKKIIKPSKLKGNNYLNKTSNTSHTSNSHNTTNTYNGQIIQNQQNINIKMVSFGDEDINKLTEGEILSILKSRNDAFINLVKLVHLNKRLPQYNNILINNLRSDYGSIYDEDKFVVCNKNQIMADLITNRLSDLQQLIVKYNQTKQLTKREIETLSSVIAFLKTCNLEDEDIDGNIIRPDKDTTKKIKDLYKELIFIFYNDRNLVEQTLKQIDTDNNLLIDNLNEDYLDV